MRTLALLLTGPLQSWGVRSTFDERDTAPSPTRSGLMGLFASARGIARHQPLPEQWSHLELLVRRDQRGRVLTDYHTVGGDRPAKERMITAEGKRRKSAVITRRAYLADAAFAAFVAGPPEVVEDLAEALRHPHWAPYLGRRGCPPSLPVLLGTCAPPPLEMAQHVPLYCPKPKNKNQETIEVTAQQDAPPGEHCDADFRVNDIPYTRSPDTRSFLTRLVVELPVSLPAHACAGTGMSGYTKLVEAIEEER